MPSDREILEGLVHSEKERVRQSVPRESVYKKLLLHELVRVIDTYFNFDKKGDLILNTFYQLGWDKTLNLVLGSYINEPRWVSHSSNNHSWEWANSIIQHCGKIAVAERLLLFETAGFAELIYDHKEKIFYVTYTAE